jgi:hypothetical protein
MQFSFLKCYEPQLWSPCSLPTDQGCQMVSFQTKNPNLGIFWRALDWKIWIYFMAIWNILQTFGIFYGHLEYFMTIWYICVNLVHLFWFWYYVRRKIWQPRRCFKKMTVCLGRLIFYLPCLT